MNLLFEDECFDAKEIGRNFLNSQFFDSVIVFIQKKILRICKKFQVFWDKINLLFFLIISDYGFF